MPPTTTESGFITVLFTCQHKELRFVSVQNTQTPFVQEEEQLYYDDEVTNQRKWTLRWMQAGLLRQKSCGSESDWCVQAAVDSLHTTQYHSQHEPSLQTGYN